MIISVHREAATAIFINPTAKLLPDLTQSLPGQNHPAQVQTVHLDIQTLIRKVPAATVAARQGHPAAHILAANQKLRQFEKSSYYDGYDDGYDDVYMDGDYDYDRYDRDPDYADGVDDALDEFDGDW